MGRFKKLCAVVYLLSCVVALGTFAASLFGPATGRVEALLDKPAFSIVLVVCLVICALQALWVLLRVIIERPEPDCVRIDAAGVPNMVSSAASTRWRMRWATSSKPVSVKAMASMATRTPEESLPVMRPCTSSTSTSSSRAAARATDSMAVNVT